MLEETTTNTQMPETSSIMIKIFEKVLEASAPVRSLAVVLNQCVTNIVELAQAITVLAHNQEVINRAVAQLAVLVAKTSSVGPDVRMPSISGPKTNDKPN